MTPDDPRLEPLLEEIHARARKSVDAPAPFDLAVTAWTDLQLAAALERAWRYQLTPRMDTTAILARARALAAALPGLPSESLELEIVMAFATAFADGVVCANQAHLSHAIAVCDGRYESRPPRRVRKVE